MQKSLLDFFLGVWVSAECFSSMWTNHWLNKQIIFLWPLYFYSQLCWMTFQSMSEEHFFALKFRLFLSAAVFFVWFRVHINPNNARIFSDLSLTLLPTGFLINDYSWGGSLGPQSYFQLILSSFWTHGTIIDQFIVKGVHQWLCKKNFWGYPKNYPSYSNFPLREKFLKI